MMCISLFSYGSPVVVRCMGFGWVWVGFGHGSMSSPGGGLGWVGSVCLWVGLGRGLWKWTHGKLWCMLYHFKTFYRVCRLHAYTYFDSTALLCLWMSFFNVLLAFCWSFVVSNKWNENEVNIFITTVLTQTIKFRTQHYETVAWSPIVSHFILWQDTVYSVYWK